jgi:SAM-dependent methyltransferase
MSFFNHFLNSPGTPVGNWIKRKTRNRMFTIIKNYLPRIESKILEIGPGMGDLAECFRAGGYQNYLVVEPNEIMRNLLSDKGFETKDYLVPPINEDNNSFDAIILVDVFEHLNDAREASEFMSEARRVLCPGGILCIHSPDYLHWKSDFFNSDYSHSNVTTVRRTIQLFHNNGFFTSRFVYFSGLLTGVFATITSLLVQFCFFILNGNALDSKLYKLKLTFLRRFLIIGLVEDSQNL